MSCDEKSICIPLPNKICNSATSVRRQLEFGTKRQIVDIPTLFSTKSDGWDLVGFHLHIFPFHLLKFVNLQYNTLVFWFVGTNDSSTKHLMFKVFFFFITSCKILQKIVFIYFLLFYDFTKLKIESFECPKSIRNSEKKMMLGTSDAWLMSHLSQQTSEPAYHIVDCRILDRSST